MSIHPRPCRYYGRGTLLTFIDMANYDKLLCLEELVQSKSRYADPEDDDAFEAFDAIMHAVNIDAAEKARLLWIEN